MSSTTLEAIRLSRADLRILLADLESKQEGFKRSDLRRLDKISDKITEALGTFGTAIEQVFIDARERITEIQTGEFSAETSAQISFTNSQANARIEALEDSLGSEVVDLLVESAERQFIVETFSSIDKWNGSKRQRRATMRIEEALDKWNIRQVPVVPSDESTNGQADRPIPLPARKR